MTSANKAIDDHNMLDLLRKYPFLRYGRTPKGTQDFHGKSANIRHNYYKEFDGSGWESLWKEYLTRLFTLYDTWDKRTRKAFCFYQVKEKFGTMRIYTSFYTGLEDIAEKLSAFTCIDCGATPRNEKGERIIWTSRCYILPFCQECASKRIRNDDDEVGTQFDIEYANDFASIQYGNGTKMRIPYKESHNWLEKGTPEPVQ